MRPFIISSLTMFSILLLIVPQIALGYVQGGDYYPMATRETWPMFGGGTERTSFSPWDGPIRGGKEWAVNLGPNMDSAPAIVDGTVYLGQDRRLVALDLVTGQRKWSVNADNIVSVHPLVHNGMVIFNGLDGGGGLVAVNKDTGKFIWSTQVGEMYTTSPLAVGDIIYTATDVKGLYALDAKTGSILWNNSKARGYMHSSIAYHDGILYGTGMSTPIFSHSWTDGGVFAMDAATQEILWTTEREGYPSSVVYSEGRVIVKVAGELIVYNATDGKKVWQKEYDEKSWNAIESSPAVGLGLVFGGAQIKNKDNFRCYSLANGSLLWARSLVGGVISTPLVAANGVVYVQAYGISFTHSLLYAIDAFTGTDLWTAIVEGGSTIPLALADGILLVAGGTTLTAFSQREKPWEVADDTAGLLVVMFFIEGLIAFFMVSNIIVDKKKKRKGTNRHNLPRNAFQGSSDDRLLEPASPQGEPIVETSDDEKIL